MFEESSMTQEKADEALRVMSKMFAVGQENTKDPNVQIASVFMLATFLAKAQNVSREAYMGFAAGAFDGLEVSLTGFEKEGLA